MADIHQRLQKAAAQPRSSDRGSRICIIPSLYAWFNIAANFDPYASTGDIKVAVANSDKGAENELTGRLDAGGEIVSNLKENDALGWVLQMRRRQWRA